MKNNLILKNIFTITCLLGVITLAFAQHSQPGDTITKEKRIKKFEPNQAFMIAPTYTAQFPYGDMRDRFGFNNLFGVQLAYKSKTNWVISLEGNFLYGSKVKDGYILNGIATTSGQFINKDNDLTNLRLQEIGGSIKLIAGKVVPFSRKYPDAGLLFLTGVGFLQHKIGINVRENSLPQLDKVYRKGYDRMTNGPVISQFIGGIFMARRKFISAYAGVQFDLGFTQNRRPYDFYAMGKLNEKRLDMFLGIKVGWVIPVFIQASEKEFYYY
jgi:hypothetical protein